MGRTPPPPAPPPRASRPPRPPNRWLALGVLAAVALATLAGGAPLPGPPPEATIPARLGAQTFAAGDRFFVIDPAERIDPAGGTTPPSVAGHRLPDGRPLWRVALPITRAPGAGPLDARVVGDTLVVSGSTGPSPDSVAQLAGLDAATGALRWRRTGYAMGATPGGLVLVWLFEGGPGPADGRLTLLAVQPTTGEVRWSLPMQEGRSLLVEDDGRDPVRSLVTVVPPGRVETRDVETGATLRSAELPGAPFDAERPRDIVAGLLLVPDERRGVLTAYGLDRLDRRWTVEMRPVDGPFAAECGDAICLWGDEAGVRVLDPRDGRTRWWDPRWHAVERVGRYLVASDNGVWCRLGPRCGDISMPPARLAVLDPETGRRLGEFGAWQWVNGPGGGDRLLVMRTDVRTGRAEVARLDPAALTLRPIAMLNRVSGQCGTAGGVLFCRRRDASVALWRLPR